MKPSSDPSSRRVALFGGGIFTVVIGAALAFVLTRDQVNLKRRAKSADENLVNPAPIFAEPTKPELREVLRRAAQEAVHIKDHIPEFFGSKHDRALFNIASLQVRVAVKSGDRRYLTDARETLEACAFPIDRAVGRALMALGLAQMGDKDGALKEFAASLDRVSSFDKQIDRDVAVEFLLPFLIDASLWTKDRVYLDLAKSAATTVEKDVFKSMTLENLGKAQAKLGYSAKDKHLFSQAFLTAEAVGPHFHIDEILTPQFLLAIETKDDELLADVHARIEKLEYAPRRARALASVAKAYAVAGRKADALETFHSAAGVAQEKFVPTYVLSGVAKKAAEATMETRDETYLTLCLNWITKLSEPRDREYIYFDLTRAFARLAAETGDKAFLERGEEIVRTKLDRSAMHGLAVDLIADAQVSFAVRTRNVSYLQLAKRTMESRTQFDRDESSNALLSLIAAQVKIGVGNRDEALVRQTYVAARGLKFNKLRARRRLVAALVEEGRYPKADEISMEFVAGEPRCHAYIGMAEGLMRQVGWWEETRFDK